MNSNQTIFPYQREPIYHVGTSTGKDSVGLMLWVIHKSGLPRERVRFTFCDTGNEDPLTYAHLEYLNEKVVLPAGYSPIETLIPALQFFDLCFREGRFPSRKAQFCTVELKIEPTRKWIREQWKRGEDVVLLNGKRSGESEERRRSMKDQPARAFSDYWGCEEWSPLREWTLEQVLALHREYGVELNPLYALGARRVGCWPCINCGKLESASLRSIAPRKSNTSEPRKSGTSGLGRVSPFFHGKTTTKNHHDLEYTRTDGKKFGTASIHAVVKWAKTERGGVIPRPEGEEPATVCHSQYLACE